MSKLTAEQRRNLPLSDFGDPERRLFPIVDADDVESSGSLIGKAKDPEAVKRRIIAIAKRKGLSAAIPKAWLEDDKAKHSITFSDGELVIREGVLFEAGDYPDKQFSMTPEELLAATADFSPVPVGLEHVPNVLDGKLGEVREIWLDDDGVSLRGRVALPKWLDDVVPEDQRKVSAEWNRATKRMEKLDLVLEPRVAGAALFAAFAARHDTPNGQYAIQELHDLAARHGAVCNPPAQMASKHEAKAIQSAHDLAVEHGAQCAAMPKPGMRPAPYFSVREDKQRSLVMKITEFFSRWMAAGAPEEVEPAQLAALTGAPATPNVVPFAQPAAQPSAELDQLRKELAAEKAKRVAAEAAAFADARIQDKRALPAEREAIIAAFTQATMDDASHGVVTFSDGRTQSRVSQLEALFSARPQHVLTTEHIDPNADVRVLVNQTQTTPPLPNGEGNTGNGQVVQMSDERRKKLLEMTAIGRAALSARNGTNSN